MLDGNFFPKNKVLVEIFSLKAITNQSKVLGRNFPPNISVGQEISLQKEAWRKIS